MIQGVVEIDSRPDVEDFHLYSTTNTVWMTQETYQEPAVIYNQINWSDMKFQESKFLLLHFDTNVPKMGSSKHQWS